LTWGRPERIIAGPMNRIQKAKRLYGIMREYRAGNLTPKSLPIRLWFDSSSYCNLKCTMCPNKDLEQGQRGTMDLDLFKRIIDQVTGSVADINLHHRGEPLLNKNLFEMIRYARERDIRVRFHTNGCLMTEEKAAAIIEAQPDLISFSIDGFEKEAYEKVRIGGTFEETVKNVLKLLELRRKAGKKLPYVVVERINFEGTKLSAEAEVRATALREEFLAAGVNEVVTKEEFIWAEDEMAKRETPQTYKKCTFPWYAMVVGWNGDVTPCPQDFFAKMVLGNLAEQTVEEVWHGQPYQDLRDKLQNDLDSLSMCRRCDRLCRKTVKGLPLQYMMPFLIDHFVGYNKLRTWLGTAERNG